jgi:hypothetical protein
MWRQVVVALIECPECRNEVSDKAAACLNCGHPIADPAASARVKRLLKQAPEEAPKAKGGCGSVFIVTVIVIAVILIIAGYKGEKQSANPSCKSDWHVCADNADLVNHYNGIISAQTDCKFEATKLAKYGDPKFPFLHFSTFYSGNAYVKTGVVVLLEKDAQFQNVFGVMVHSTVMCKYDLARKKVLDANVSSN